MKELNDQIIRDMESGDGDAEKMPEEMREKLLKYAKGIEIVYLNCTEIIEKSTSLRKMFQGI